MFASEEVFPHSTIFLCDFHREQSWQRWTKGRNRGLSDDEAAIVLTRLGNLAYVPPCREDGKYPDKHYREAESKLHSLDVWCNNKQVRNWLNGKWLSIPERWSRVRTAHDYQLNVFTSNGVEAQNKVLKYSFLKTRGLHVWCNNKQVRNWLNGKWLSIPERWSRVRTAHDYQLNVFTSNGVEAQNKVLKYSFLKTRSSCVVQQ